jgi:hypothetical protein
LSEKLTKILTDLKDRWDEVEQPLRTFVDEVEAGRQQDATGLDPETQAPFLGILREVEDGSDLSSDTLIVLRQITIELVAHIQQEIRLVDFWQNTNAQGVLRKWIVQYLDTKDALLSAGRHRQRPDPLEHRPERASGQMTLRQHQPVVADMFHQSPCRLDEALLEAGQRPCVDSRRAGRAAATDSPSHTRARSAAGGLRWPGTGAR